MRSGLTPQRGARHAIPCCRSSKDSTSWVAEAELMLSDYGGLRIVRHPMRPLQARVFELRDNFTAYDAMYEALAQRLALPLLNDDAKLAGAPGHHAEIQHYPG
jgi:predicted nucleic acid-binding protein